MTSKLKEELRSEHIPANQEIIKIDIDLVRRLRLSGRELEADRMIKAHQQSLMKNKQQQYKELMSIDNKTYRIQKRIHHVCLICAGPRDREDRAYCKSCRERNHAWNRQKLIKKKALAVLSNIYDAVSIFQ